MGMFRKANRSAVRAKLTAIFIVMGLCVLLPVSFFLHWDYKNDKRVIANKVSNLVEPVWLELQPDGMDEKRAEIAMLNAALRKKLYLGVLLLFCVAAAFFAFGVVLPRVIRRPIRRLAERAGGIASAKDFSLRFQCSADDGLIHLENAFNSMLDQIQERDRVLQAAQVSLEGQVSEWRKALQEAKEKAESAEHLKSAFLATLSHELRAPLNAIIGYTGILMQGMAGELNGEQRKQMGLIWDNSRQLLDLINDLLDISRIEAGQMLLDQEKFDLCFSVDRVIQSVRATAERKGLSLVVDTGAKRIELYNDRRRLEQILLNLVGNAIKFTDVGTVAVSCEVHLKEVIIRVMDTGIGIRQEDVSSLFKSFSQVDKGASRKYEGAGLGLFISKRLVELMGGRVWMESSPGVGSKFYFSLPS